MLAVHLVNWQDEATMHWLTDVISFKEMQPIFFTSGSWLTGINC